MDRSVLEADPHAVLEGMIIGGYAIGANEGYIYCRAEYPLAIKRLNIAIDQAKEYGLLGQEHPGHRLQPGHPRLPGRRRLRVRRRDRAHELHRGQARHAATPSSVPGQQGPVAEAIGPQQR
ncbi:MAG: hypothetical protein MZW92_05880 [Comamonadaceae bacterium]|nr:hypothetical protein [Comamonadaceae bacterium]